jgi:hypothetical protein
MCYSQEVAYLSGALVWCSLVLFVCSLMHRYRLSRCDVISGENGRGLIDRSELISPTQDDICTTIAGGVAIFLDASCPPSHAFSMAALGTIRSYCDEE